MSLVAPGYAVGDREWRCPLCNGCGRVVCEALYHIFRFLPPFTYSEKSWDCPAGLTIGVMDAAEHAAFTLAGLDGVRDFHGLPRITPENWEELRGPTPAGT